MKALWVCPRCSARNLYSGNACLASDRCNLCGVHCEITALADEQDGEDPAIVDIPQRSGFPFERRALAQQTRRKRR